MSQGRRTPLHERHVRLGGQMEPFAGWDMPVQYKGRGLVSEHLATREFCGLFDVSHMGEIFVTGDDAMAEVQRLVSNDVSKLAIGDACYALLCHPDGGTVDDLYVYRLGDDEFMLVVNAANIEKDFAHLRAHAHQPQRIQDRSDDYAQLALQGPLASQILQSVAPGPAIGLPRNYIHPHGFAGQQILVATTGYTGEAGFEIYCAPSLVAQLWDALLAADERLSPVGLGARDTLRLEMGYALYGHELRDDINGYEARVSWAIKLDIAPFVGSEALAQIKANKSKRRLAGLEMLDRGIPRADYPIVIDGEQVGFITSGTQSPNLKRPIAIALVDRAFAKIGTELSVDIRGRMRQAKVVKYPFYVKAD
ncbi:MAG TPA: glycine cleavage system aminomethyltransferase GcvT [Acidimicrobiaceae bacterium]|nr:glycine cleavage system aminomethyltransferase GcvT [Acidimicrobiaceae bacterium]